MTTEPEKKKVTIYSDGACLGNPGKGGYGTVLLYKGKRKELAVGFTLTTNNRMELLGAITGLEVLKEPCEVTLYTDSRYVVDGITKGWAVKWQANDWWRDKNKTEPAVNSDLWERLLKLTGTHEVEFVWVKGHAGNVENERCDRLSVEAANGDDLEIDTGYKSAQPNLLSKPSSPPNSADSKSSTTKTKITQEGQPCRHCGTPVEKRLSKAAPKPGQKYRFEYYLLCPNCNTMYMVDAAKILLDANN